MKPKMISRIFTNRALVCTLISIFLFQIECSCESDLKEIVPDFSEHVKEMNGSDQIKLTTSIGELLANKNDLLNYNYIPSWLAVAAMVVVFVMSPFFVLPLLWFLQDLPLNKQCILNSLYQDVIKANLLFVWLWTFTGMTFKILSENYMIGHLKAFVEFAAIANEGIYTLLMTYLCLIGGLRLYITKFNVLDPLADTFGTNEGRITKIIRLLLLSLILCHIVIILVTSTEPVTYFLILRNSGNVTDLPVSSITLFLFDVGILVISTSLHICSKMCQKHQDSEVQRDLLELEIHLKRNLRMTGSNPDDSLEGQRLEYVPNEGFRVYRQTFPVIIYLISSMTIMVLLALPLFDAEETLKIDFWWSLTAFIGNQGLLIPISIVFWHSTVNIYCRRQINSFVNRVEAWFTNKARIFERKKLRRVVPISNEEFEMT